MKANRRKIRRKGGSGNPAAQLQTLMAQLNQAGGMERVVQMMAEVQAQSEETYQLVSALVEDYEKLAQEAEAEREVLLDALAKLSVSSNPVPHLSPTVDEIKKDLLARIQQRLEIIQRSADTIPAKTITDPES